MKRNRHGQKKWHSSHALDISVFIVLLAGLGLISYGSLRLDQHYAATHNHKSVVSKGIITRSTSVPDETKPTNNCATYKVPSSYPEKITLPTIKSSGCIEQVGIDQYGAIAVPDNIYTAAWYVKSALPGQPGLSVIDGHISGRYNVNGIFEHLKYLHTGDMFMVTLGNNRVLYYQVYNVQSIPLMNAVHVLLSRDTSVTSQLNLITCSGTYNSATKLYDHRIIVSARLD